MRAQPRAVPPPSLPRPVRVVVTGYGPFMGITDNPSAALAKRLAELGLPNAQLEVRTLDVTTQAVDEFLADMKARPPDVILSMGVTHGRAQVEEAPQNRLGKARDGKDQLMDERRVVPDGPETLPTDLPVEAIEWALQPFGDQRKVFTSRSTETYWPDRSAYLCNYLGYQLAHAFGEKPETTAGFIHITRDTPAEQLQAALEAIVKAHGAQAGVRSGGAATTP